MYLGRLWFLSIFQLSLIAGASGGWVETLDGSRINGELVHINERHVVIRTAFSGQLQIPRTQVMRLHIQVPFIVRTEQGDVIEGMVSSDSLGRVMIRSNGELHRVHWRNLVSAWRHGAEDPVAPAVVEADPPGIKKWRLRLSLDIRGRAGNVDRFATNLRLDATREGTHDRWDLYTSYKYAVQQSLAREDEIILGTRYTSFPQGRLGWFVREELERDAFERVSIRSTTAAGASFRFIHERDLKWEGSGGLANRYERFMGGGDENIPGLEFGMTLDWHMRPHLRLRSRLNFQPSLEDIGNFLVEQDTGLEIPIDARNFWRVQLGFNSRYISDPEAVPVKLNMEYYTRVILSWD